MQADPAAWRAGGERVTTAPMRERAAMQALKALVDSPEALMAWAPPGLLQRVGSTFRVEEVRATAVAADNSSSSD